MDNLKQQEEKRRERNWDPKLRWQVIQNTLTWAAAQATCRVNTKGKRLKDQARKLRDWQSISPEKE